MSTFTQKKLLTAEEFFQLPDPGDGSQQELVRGTPHFAAFAAIDV